MTWPDTIPLTDAHELRAMRTAQGKVWLQARHPDAEPADIDAATAIACAVDEPPTPVAVILATPMLKHEFAAGAYLLGASLSQLSMILRVSRSTIHQGIGRRAPYNLINAKRRAYRLHFETLQILWKEFQKFVRSSPTIFDGMDVFQLADFLEASVDIQHEAAL